MSKGGVFGRGFAPHRSLPNEEHRRVAVVEPMCFGLEHVPFNAALVAAVLEAFPAARVDVYGEEAHLTALNELLTHTRPDRLDRVTWTPTRVPARDSRGWSRFVMTSQLLRDLDRRFDGLRPDALVFAAVDSGLIAMIKARLFLAWKGLPVVAVFHQLLASLEHGYSGRGGGLRAALAMPHPFTLKFLVLSTAIRDRLQRVAPRMHRHVTSVDHPSLLGDVTTTATAPPSGLRFGFVGGGRGPKGLLAFTRLARELSASWGNAEFHIVGAVPPGVDRGELKGLEWSDSRLPLLEYVERIRGLTHVVWLGDPDHYGLVASGSLADVISLRIPLVCHDGPFVDHLFRRFGDIGFRGATVGHVRDEVRRLLSDFSIERDRLQRERLAAARLALAPEASAEIIRRALSY